jgi:hypothetical protein
MTRLTRDTHRYGYPSRQPPEVIALLVNDGSAGTVAAAAVHEAVQRQAPIRFLQLVPEGYDAIARALAEEATFKVALHALHGHPRTHSVFEVVPSHESAAIRSRSRDAALIVVGVDSDGESSPRPALARRCEQVALCPVQTVAIEAQSPPVNVTS